LNIVVLMQILSKKLNINHQQYNKTQQYEALVLCQTFVKRQSSKHGNNNDRSRWKS